MLDGSLYIRLVQRKYFLLGTTVNMWTVLSGLGLICGIIRKAEM